MTRTLGSRWAEPEIDYQWDVLPAPVHGRPSTVYYDTALVLWLHKRGFRIHDLPMFEIHANNSNHGINAPKPYPFFSLPCFSLLLHRPTPVSSLKTPPSSTPLLPSLLPHHPQHRPPPHLEASCCCLRAAALDVVGSLRRRLRVHGHPRLSRRRAPLAFTTVPCARCRRRILCHCLVCRNRGTSCSSPCAPPPRDPVLLLQHFKIPI